MLKFVIFLIICGITCAVTNIAENYAKKRIESKWLGVIFWLLCGLGAFSLLCGIAELCGLDVI